MITTERNEIDALGGENRFRALEVDDDELTHARFKSLELLPVDVNGLLRRMPSIFHRNGGKSGAFKTALDPSDARVVR